MFFIVNRTKRTHKDWFHKIWPDFAWFVDFAKSGDTVELVDVATEDKTYYGIKYIQQTVYAYGMERINADGTGFVEDKQRAQDWIDRLRSGKATPVLPPPRCSKCHRNTEVPSDIRSIADMGKCVGCSLPSHDVIVPRPKKK